MLIYDIIIRLFIIDIKGKISMRKNLKKRLVVSAFLASWMFVPNAVYSANGDQNGGIINNTPPQTLQLDGSSYSNANAQYGGGAVANWNGGNITFSADNVEFINNKVTATGTGYGGAIYNEITAQIEVEGTSNFTGNTSNNWGGAIYNEGVLVFDKAASFSDNSSLNAGGAIVNEFLPGVTYGELTLADGSSFTNNSSAQGGAVYNNNGTATFGTTEFVGNKATNGNGGAIANTGNGSVNIAGGSSFTDNSATSGGAIYTEGTLTLDTSNGKDIEFSGNTATASGADLYQQGGTTTITGVQGTTVSFDGGIAGDGTILKSGDNTLELAGDNSGYSGTFTQESGKTVINGEFFSGVSEINGGELVLGSNGSLSADITIGTNNPEINISNQIASIVNNGTSGSISIVDSAGFNLGANTLDLVVNGTANSALSGINTIGTGANIQDLTLNGGAGLAQNEEIVVNGTELTFGSGTTNHATNTITLNDANSVLNLGNANDKGTINLNAVVANTTADTVINKDYNSTVNVVGDKSTYTGKFSQTNGTTVITDGAYFFGGENTISNGELVLENGGHFANGSVNNVVGAGLNDPYGTLVLKNDETGAQNTNIDWTTGTVTTTEVAPDGSSYTSEVVINKGGLHLANGLIQESNYEGGFSLFEGQTGIRELELSNGSGVVGNIAANDNSILTYNDGAFIDDKATITMGDGVTVNLNFDEDTEFNTNITTSTSGGVVSNINKNGSGNVTMDKAIGDVTTSQYVNTNLNLNGGAMTVEKDVAILGDINMEIDTSLLANGQIAAKSINAVDAMLGTPKDFNLSGDMNLTLASSAELYGQNNNIGGNVLLSNSDLISTNDVNVAKDLTVENGYINLAVGRKAASLNVEGTTKLSGVTDMVINADGRDYSAGGIKTSNLVVDDAGAEIVLEDINFVATPRDYNFNIKVVDSVSEKVGGDLTINLDNKLIDTPVGKYALIAGEGGMLSGALTSINPQAYRGQVATVSSYANQLVHNNLLFDHINIVSQQLIAEERVANKYSSIDAQFSPYQYSAKEGSLWFKAYGNFETISMTQGLNVHNNSYGSLIGADFPVVNLRDGWKLIPTAYVSYNGAHQTYNGVGMYQNGGQLGVMGTAYKGDFLTSLLAYGGGYYNNMNVSGYTDRTGNWFAGVASKTAYNFHLPADFILQPTMLLSYNIFGEQNWHSNYGIIGMNSGMLNGINIAPGANLIWNKETFSLYATAQLVFNIMGDVGGQVGNITLPDVGYRHVAYVEYGLGATKRIKERLNSFVQFTIRNGTRTGIGFQGGLQWRI